MMAVPFTFRSSTPHVPGEGEAAALPPSTKEEVGSIYKGGGDTLPLFCSLGADTRAGCMQCFRSKHKHLFILIFLLFLHQQTRCGPMGSENCDLG